MSLADTSGTRCSGESLPGWLMTNETGEYVTSVLTENFFLEKNTLWAAMLRLVTHLPKLETAAVFVYVLTGCITTCSQAHRSPTSHQPLTPVANLERTPVGAYLWTVGGSHADRGQGGIEPRTCSANHRTAVLNYLLKQKSNEQITWQQLKATLNWAERRKTWVLWVKMVMSQENGVTLSW